MPAKTTAASLNTKAAKAAKPTGTAYLTTDGHRKTQMLWGSVGTPTKHTNDTKQAKGFQSADQANKGRCFQPEFPSQRGQSYILESASPLGGRVVATAPHHGGRVAPSTCSRSKPSGWAFFVFRVLKPSRKGRGGVVSFVRFRPRLSFGNTTSAVGSCQAFEIAASVASP